MQAKQKNFFSLLEIILLGSGLVLLALVVSQIQTSGGSEGEETIESPFPPTPTPGPGEWAYPPVPTHGNPAPLAISLTPTPTDDPEWLNWTPQPTEPPIIYSEVIDLSPELPENEEYFVFVQRGTGEYIIYTIGPIISQWRDAIPQSIIDQIPLGSNDLLLGGNSPFPWRDPLWKHLGYTATPTNTPIPPTDTLNTYPFGWTPTFTPTFTPTINPYP